MRIVIAGAGKLGYSIAELLANDEFDVVVIESDHDRIDNVQNALDVLTIEGNACSPLVYKDPDVKDSDVLIACTDSDEANMVSSLMAKKYGFKHTAARIRDVDYMLNAPNFLKNDMKIDLALNPENITAKEINRILTSPAALNVDDFADGKVMMFEAKLKEDSEFAGTPLKNLHNIPKNILIAMFFRKNKMIIPGGNDVLEPGDNVYFVGKKDDILEFQKRFVNVYDRVERVMIIGAGRTGRFLAPLLEQDGFQVKVIDKDKRRCQILAGQLNRGLVMHGDGTDINLLLEEGVSEADVVVCLTEDDKLNLMIAQLAKHLGAKKTVVRVARNEYIELMEKVGVDIVLSARLLVAGEVIKFVRRGGIESISLLEGAQAQAIELVVGAGSSAHDTALKDLKLPKESLICAVVRKNEVIIPNGFTVLQPLDHIILFIKSDLAKSTTPLFEKRD